MSADDSDNNKSDSIESDSEQPSTSCSTHDSWLDDNSNIDYWSFKLEMYSKEFPWLYYNAVEKGFKCKYCELFPAVGIGNYIHKLGKEAAKSLGDHPHRFLKRHQESDKHKSSLIEYEG